MITCWSLSWGCFVPSDFVLVQAHTASLFELCPTGRPTSLRKYSTPLAGRRVLSCGTSVAGGHDCQGESSLDPGKGIERESNRTSVVVWPLISCCLESA